MTLTAAPARRGFRPRLTRPAALVPAVLVAAFGLAGCMPTTLPISLPSALNSLPAMPWDGKPHADAWTQATLMAVATQDAVLAEQVPSDVARYCPGYAKAPIADRRAFWAGLMALTAKAESGYNPAAAAKGGYVGLMQISPKTAANAGCSVTSSGELKDGENNMFCAVQIMSAHVAADGQAVGDKGNRGIGRDWMPWRKADFRAKAAAYLSSQSYCQ